MEFSSGGELLWFWQQEDRQKVVLEEYLEKRAQAKKQQQKILDERIAKMELERSRRAPILESIERA